MRALDTASGQVVEQEVNWAERAVRFLSNPVVSPFLLSLGFLGLLVEVRTPTFGLAGVAGALPSRSSSGLILSSGWRASRA